MGCAGKEKDADVCVWMGERREARCMIREGAWRVVSDRRVYAGVSIQGWGVLCLVLRFDV